MSSLFFDSVPLHISSSQHPLWLPLDNLTTNYNCSDGVQWILVAFQQCVLDQRHYVAIIFGLISIVAWALNALPQIVENCRNGLADEAMSPYLLAFWMLGDVLNLVGCFMTHQLILQYYTAAYSILCDIILVGQFIAAKTRRRIARARAKDAADNGINTDASGIISTQHLSHSVEYYGGGTGAGTLLASLALGWTLCGFGWQLALQPALVDSTVTHVGGRRLLFHLPIFFNSVDLVGYLIGCASSAAYLSARLPQLYQNYKRRSTVGLSLGLFLLALLANVGYSMQIFLTSMDRVFLIRHFPWILGSLGVVTLDMFMVSQFCYYKRSNSDADLEASEEVDSSVVMIYD